MHRGRRGVLRGWKAIWVVEGARWCRASFLALPCGGLPARFSDFGGLCFVVGIDRSGSAPLRSS